MKEILLASNRQTTVTPPTDRPVSAHRTNSRKILQDSIDFTLIGTVLGEFTDRKYGTDDGLMRELADFRLGTVNRAEHP
jgi:hypothetical protein